MPKSEAPQWIPFFKLSSSLYRMSFFGMSISSELISASAPALCPLTFTSTRLLHQLFMDFPSALSDERAIVIKWIRIWANASVFFALVNVNRKLVYSIENHIFAIFPFSVPHIRIHLSCISFGFFHSLQFLPTRIYCSSHAAMEQPKHMRRIMLAESILA